MGEPDRPDAVDQPGGDPAVAGQIVASFSGDDPNTPTREAFDAPMSSGLDKWVQGVNFKKVVTNSNLNTHRVRLYLSPSETVNYTFDYFRLWADVPNAAGQRQYGDEINLALRWAISKPLAARWMR